MQKVNFFAAFVLYLSLRSFSSSSFFLCFFEKEKREARDVYKRDYWRVDGYRWAHFSAKDLSRKEKKTCSSFTWKGRNYVKAMRLLLSRRAINILLRMEPRDGRGQISWYAHYRYSIEFVNK